MSDLLYRYEPPGPVAKAFINDQTSFVPFIMGPVGSGKTTAAIFKRMMFGCAMPVCRDGKRRCKAIVVRDNFRTLEKTLLASWLQWFPKGYPGSDWTGGNDRPAIHTLRFNVRGVETEIITEFAALGSHRVEEVLRGWEGSFGWMNEADIMSRDVAAFLKQRLALRRYPARGLLPEGVEPPAQMIGDFNAPDVDNWIYADFVEAPPPGHKLYRQPSGLSAEAENRKFVSIDGYRQMVASEPDWWVRRFVHAEFGYSRDGKPVHSEFNEQLHVAPAPLAVEPNLPLVIGLDAGMVPAAALLQPRPNGQLRVTDELVPGHGVGPVRFAEYLLELMASRYGAVRDVYAYVDPAAQWGADREAGEMTWLEIVANALGLPLLIPGDGSNEIAARLEAVRQPLATLIDGREPGLIISPHCRFLIKGFASEYRYKRIQQAGGDRYDDLPDKSRRPFVDVHDALQYACLGWRGRMGIISAASREKRGGRAGWGGRGSGRRRDFDVHAL